MGQSHDFPGGFGTYLPLDENLIMPIQSALDPALAAMTSPWPSGWNTPGSARPPRTT